MCDRSSPTKDGTHAPEVKCRILTIRQPGRSCYFNFEEVFLPSYLSEVKNLM